MTDGGARDMPGRDEAARWARISALFDAAEGVPADEREAWLHAQVPDDPALRDELRLMLEAASSDGVLDRSLLPLTADPPSADTIAGRLALALEGRYRLDQEIGRGGMGAIFRAHELKHQRDVILKVLRPDVAVSVGRKRFAGEVRIAAQLAHPHIVPLLDSGEADGLLYFVMPRIPGETLRERLRRNGQLDVMDAMRLLRDIADALMHAHEAGVVHRDLKPENVLCSGDHAFLLDFGIAQWTELAEDQRITGAGLAIGTPRYMAPEQAAGRAVDHRADLYAWGLVASEMLLGPRGSDLDISTARSDVPRALATLIYRCLAPDPSLRPRSAGTIVAAIDSIMTGGQEPAAAAMPARPRAERWPAALAVGLGVLVLAGMWLTTRPRAVVAADELRMPIAVAPFRDESADSGSVRGRLAGAWITQGLQEAGLFQVAPWTTVIQATDGRADAFAALRDQLRAGTIVSGTFFDTPEALALHVEIRETHRGTLLASIAPVTVPRDSSALAIRMVRERVMGALAARRDPRFVGVAAILERPPTFDSYRAFERAVAQFNAQRYRESIDGFRTAFALDSGFIPPMVYAAQAAWNTAQVDLLDSLLSTLERRRSELTDYHDAVRSYLRAVRDGEGTAAFDAAARAAAIAPESRAAYDAAVVSLWLGRPDEARARLERMSPDRGAMLGWPSYWTNLAHARHLTGDHRAELAAAREMRRRHPALRVAWTLEARALVALRDSAALDSLFAAADSLDPHTYWSQGGMLVTAGEEMAAHGDTLGGRRLLERADAWLAARLQERPADGDHLYWHGSALHSLGRYAEAREALDLLARRSPHRMQFIDQAALAAVRAGDAGALARLAEPPPFDLGARRVSEARVAAAAGDAEQASALMRDALRRGYRSWSWLHGVAWRDLLPLSGDTALARLVGQPAP
jgi:tetratricopeptide (TPR) repeat protein